MPEGPEVKLTAENINFYSKNNKITNCKILCGRYVRHGPPEGYEEFLKKLPLNIIKIYSKGKGIFIELSNDVYIYNTLGMSGSWASTRDKHCGFEFILEKIDDKQSKKLYFRDIRNFGYMKFIHNKNEFIKTLDRWGPDILDKDTNLEIFKERIKKHINKNITKVLMNQSIISGIGNYIKAEALYKSKISPLRTMNSLSDDEVKLLFNSLKEIAESSYKLNGNTIRTYQNFEGVKGNYESLLKVYMKKKDPLGNNVVKITTDDRRTTHWVPEIQK